MVQTCHVRGHCIKRFKRLSTWIGHLSFVTVIFLVSDLTVGKGKRSLIFLRGLLQVWVYLSIIERDIKFRTVLSSVAFLLKMLLVRVHERCLFSVVKRYLKLRSVLTSTALSSSSYLVIRFSSHLRFWKPWQRPQVLCKDDWHAVRKPVLEEEEMLGEVNRWWVYNKGFILRYLTKPLADFMRLIRCNILAKVESVCTLCRHKVFQCSQKWGVKSTYDNLSRAWTLEE